MFKKYISLLISISSIRNFINILLSFLIKFLLFKYSFTGYFKYVPILYLSSFEELVCIPITLLFDISNIGDPDELLLVLHT